MKKICFTGSRRHGRQAELRRLLLLLEPDWVIHGGAQGVDLTAGHVCATEFESVVITAYPIHPELDGPWPGCGPRRNRRMLEDGQPDLVVALPCPQSKGTWDCVRQAARMEIPVLVVPWTGAVEPDAEQKSFFERIFGHG